MNLDKAMKERGGKIPHVASVPPSLHQPISNEHVTSRIHFVTFNWSPNSPHPSHIHSISLHFNLRRPIIITVSHGCRPRPRARKLTWSLRRHRPQLHYLYDVNIWVGDVEKCSTWTFCFTANAKFSDTVEKNPHIKSRVYQKKSPFHLKLTLNRVCVYENTCSVRAEFWVMTESCPVM